MYGHDGQDDPEKQTLSDQDKKNIMSSSMLPWGTLNELINEGVLWFNIDDNLETAVKKLEVIEDTDLTPDQLEQKLRTIKTCIDSALGQLEERQDNE